MAPRLGNILDPVRAKLSSRVWDSPGSRRPRLKPELKKWIQETIFKELRRHGYTDPERWCTLVFTGSLTTYQYSDESDLDISLFVDNHRVPDWSRAEMVGICIKHIDGKKYEDLPYPLQCYVVPSTLTREDLYAPGLRSGYELETDKWINPPERGRSRDVKKAQPEDYAYAIEQVDKMQLLLKHEPDKAEMLWDQIHRRRRNDQKAGKGDYAQSNIVYKALANWGLMPQLEALTGEHIAHQRAQHEALRGNSGKEGRIFELQHEASQFPSQTNRSQTPSLIDLDDERRDTEDTLSNHISYNALRALASKESFSSDDVGSERPSASQHSSGNKPYHNQLSFDDSDRYKTERIQGNKNQLPEASIYSSSIPHKVSQDYIEDTSSDSYEFQRGIVGNKVNFPEIEKLTGEHLAKTAMNITQTIYDSVLQNAGITINLNGQQPESGYAFSPFKETEVVVPLESFSPEGVASYLTAYEAQLRQPNNYFGAWVDNGQVYLDVSQVIQDRDEAIRRARAADQLGIFDLNTGQTIDTRPQVTAGLDHQAVLDANRGTDLQGLPQKVQLPGYGPVQFHSHQGIQDIANSYMRQSGIGDQHPQEYVKVRPDVSTRIAEEYDRMPHRPNDPQVKASYDALKAETLAQYQHAVKNGYNFEFYPKGRDPYPNSPREAVLDLHHNKHMYVYPTDDGFGTGDEQYPDHPLLGDSGVRWGGRPVAYNDLFRAVHDFYGHAKEGLGFRADGEDNAWRQHQAMYSPLARGAMTAETRGQNSYVNFGPHGETNQTANQEDTVFAPQKAGILPEWVHDTGLHKTSMDADKVIRHDIDHKAVQRAAHHLGLRHPVRVTQVQGTNGVYNGLQTEGDLVFHDIQVVSWLYPKSANTQVWHELGHARQREQGDQHHYAWNFQGSTDKYRDHPSEREAREVADKAPFMVTTAVQHAKLVFDPYSNTLVVGKDGKIEGEHLNHDQLAREHGIHINNMTQFGDVNSNGYASMYPRPTLVKNRDENFNPYRARWQFAKAINHAFPDAKILGHDTSFNPQQWENEWRAPTLVGPRFDTQKGDEGVEWQF